MTVGIRSWPASGAGVPRSARGSMLTNALLLAGGFLLFLLVQYGTLFSTGQLFTAGEPLNVIVAIQFLPILVILAIFMTYFARRTDRVYTGAFAAVSIRVHRRRRPPRHRYCCGCGGELTPGHVCDE